MGRDRAHAERVAIGRRARRRADAEAAAGPRLVLDDEAAADAGGEPVREDAAEKVRRAARGEGHDDRHRARRPAGLGAGE